METLEQLKPILEAALMAAAAPLSVAQLKKLFTEEGEATVDAPQIREALKALQADYASRGVHMVELASGFCFRVPDTYATWVKRLWAEKPPRYSRALLETLALIAYKQPITRSEIEVVRGVGVSPKIIQTLLEREWIEVRGHKEVPGRPALFGTTKQFLDDLNLQSLKELPSLPEVELIESLEPNTQVALPLQAPSSDAENTTPEEMASEPSEETVDA